MKLMDFFIIIKRKITLFSMSTIIAAIILMIPTVLISLVTLSVTATLRVGSNMMLLAPSTPTLDSGYSLSVAPILPADKLDDKAAVDYLQNSKLQWKSSGLVDYSSLAEKVSDIAFLNSAISSTEFKNYLKKEGVIKSTSQISIIEQSDSLSIKLSGEEADEVRTSYNKMLELIPLYLDTAVKERLGTVANGLESSVNVNSQRIDQLIGEYSALKEETGFADMLSYNKALTFLNSISTLSGNISANADTLQKLGSIMQNDLSATVLVKSFSDSGLSPINNTIPYLIIELLASILVGCLIVFISAFYAKTKAAARE